MWDGVLRLARERRAEYLEELAKRAVAEFKIKLDERTWRKMMYYLRRDLLGYGVLDPLVRDPYIEDIHVVPNVRRRVLEAAGSLRLFLRVSASLADGYTGSFLRVALPGVSWVEARRF